MWVPWIYRSNGTTSLGIPVQLRLAKTSKLRPIQKRSRAVVNDDKFLRIYFHSHFSPKKSAATGFFAATSTTAQSGSIETWRALLIGDWSWKV